MLPLDESGAWFAGCGATIQTPTQLATTMRVPDLGRATHSRYGCMLQQRVSGQIRLVGGSAGVACGRKMRATGLPPRQADQVR